MSRRILAGTFVAALAATSSPARADGTETAQSLFDEAKSLALAGRWAEACPKLEKSEQLEPNMLTLYRLGDCYEHVDRLASAWSHYVEAAELAKTAGSAARYDQAIARANALHPRLGVVHVVVESPAPDEHVDVDGYPIKRELFGAEIPLDAGEHVLRAGAPGKVDATTRVRVVDGEKANVTVPALADASTAPPPPPPPKETHPPPPAPPKASSRWSTMRTVGAVSAGAGVLALGASVALGFSAKSLDDRAASHCGAAGCDHYGKTKNDDARQIGNIGTGVFIGGAALVTLGAVLWFVVAPSSEERHAQRMPLAWTF